MNKPGRYLIASLILYMAFAGFSQQDTQVNKSRESYSIIIQRNIFSKDRSVRKPERVEVPKPDPNSIVAPPDIAFVYVLRGVAIDIENKIAFFENQSSGEFFQASIGEQIDDMAIKDIKADRVVFDKDQKEFEIMVGMDLSGVVIGSAANTVTSGSSGSSDSSSSSSGSGGASPGIQGEDESEILRKMMERRKQQVGN